MKKILLATTALALSAGVANAQAVTIGGQGRMGLIYTGGAWATEHRLRLNFGVSVAGDHGLTFGAFTRAQMQNQGTGVFSGSRVWVASNGLQLTFGNQDGAVAAVGYVGGRGIGYTGGSFSSGYANLLTGMNPQQFSSTTGGRDIVSISYSMSGLNAMLSHDFTGPTSTQVGMNYAFDAFTVAFGYHNGAADFWTISGLYNGGNWNASLIIAGGAAYASTSYTLGAQAAVGGGSVSGYLARINGSTDYGLSYGYGLGGGATIAVGAERVSGATTGNVGVVFNF